MKASRAAKMNTPHYFQSVCPEACAAGVVTKTTDRDSVRYTYNGTRRVRQLALGYERN